MNKVYRRSEVCTLLEVSEEFVIALEAVEIVTLQSDGLFTAQQADRIRISWNLHSDLGVNLAGIDVALRLLDRLDRQHRVGVELVQRLDGLADEPPTP